MFSRVPDYRSIFASAEETSKYIYGDPDRTADIIFSEPFLLAMSQSPHQKQVDMIIRQHALEGNTPSALYMISLLGMMYSEMAQALPAQPSLKEPIRTLLRERIQFCDVAIRGGRGEQAYYAMSSSNSLYSLLADDASAKSECVRALKNIVNYGEMFLQSNSSDHELIDEVREAVEYWRPHAQLATQVFG